MTCFSCGRVLDSKDCADPSFSELHSPTCERELVSESEHGVNPALSLRQLLMGIGQVLLLIAAAANFQVSSKSSAHTFYAILIITTGINISIIKTISLLGPSVKNILKGIANFFLPLFPPTPKSSKQEVNRALRFHLFLASVTSLSICLITTIFHAREDKTIHVTFSVSHWLVIFLNLGVLLTYSCFNFCKNKL